jgi:prefoldin subunit 5
MKDHVSAQCSNREIECEYQYAGCDVKKPQGQLESHGKEALSSHLSLVANLVQGSLSQKDNEIQELKEELSHQRMQIQELKQQHTDLQGRTNRHWILVFLFSIFMILLSDGMVYVCLYQTDLPIDLNISMKETNVTLSSKLESLGQLPREQFSSSCMNVSNLTDLYSKIQELNSSIQQVAMEVNQIGGVQQEFSEVLENINVMDLGQPESFYKISTMQMSNLSDLCNKVYFQWCVRRLKKGLAGSIPEDQDGADFARMVFEYMMAASKRKLFEMYNLTDQQVLTDAKGEFGVINDSLDNSDILKQIGEIIAGRVSEEGKEEISGATPSTSEAAFKDTERGGGGGGGTAGMSYKDVYSEISAAIDFGAPAYNKGDHKGCYDRYRATGEKILENCSLKGVRQKLRSAVELANKQPSFTKQAWTMRHAFDAILRGDIDTSDFTDTDKKELAKSTRADDDDDPAEMGYKKACREISAAISQGAPTFNEGDHEGCFNTYKQVAEKILKECTVAGVKRELHSALETVSKQASATKRAWTLRHAFDAILQGNIDTKSQKR